MHSASTSPSPFSLKQSLSSILVSKEDEREIMEEYKATRHQPTTYINQYSGNLSSQERIGTYQSQSTTISSMATLSTDDIEITD
jgi:hypothetical protein